MKGPQESAAAGTLAGRGVLVTRPAGQAAGLCRLVEQRGGRAIRFPGIEIRPPLDPGPVRAQLERLPGCDIAIFVSPNAVQGAVDLLGGRGLPAGPRVAAVGEGTRRALEARGTRVDITPADRYDSEGLLGCEALRRVAGRRVCIVRGVGGLPLLGETLAERGAEVLYIEVYRRARPEADPRPLVERWPREVQAVTVTSGEILENLFALLGPDAGLLRRTPLVVISGRVAARAEALGCERVAVAERADDAAIVAAVEALLEGSGG